MDEGSIQNLIDCGFGCLYIVWIREFIKNNQGIYKFGRTQNMSQRMLHYPKGSQLMCCIFTNNHVKFEKEILDIFRKEFKQRLDLGHEYFEGSIKSIKYIFFKFDHLNSEVNTQSIDKYYTTLWPQPINTNEDFFENNDTYAPLVPMNMEKIWRHRYPYVCGKCNCGVFNFSTFQNHFDEKHTNHKSPIKLDPSEIKEYMLINSEYTKD